MDRRQRKSADILIQCQCAGAEEKEIWELNEDGSEFVRVKKLVGCDESCINRVLFYECDPKHCPCGEACSNRRFQEKRDFQGLQVYPVSLVCLQ